MNYIFENASPMAQAYYFGIILFCLNPPTSFSAIVTSCFWLLGHTLVTFLLLRLCILEFLTGALSSCLLTNLLLFVLRTSAEQKHQQL